MSQLVLDDCHEDEQPAGENEDLQRTSELEVTEGRRPQAVHEHLSEGELSHVTTRRYFGRRGRRGDDLRRQWLDPEARRRARHRHAAAAAGIRADGPILDQRRTKSADFPEPGASGVWVG